MQTELEQTLILIANEIRQQTKNTGLFIEFMEKLTDVNNAISFTHKSLMPIIKDFSEYLTNLPTLMNDIVAMNEEMKLFIENTGATYNEILVRLTKITEVLEDGKI